MRTFYFSCFFVMLSVLQLEAQNQADFKKETIEFIKLTGSGAAFEKAIDQIGAGVSVDKKGEYLAEAQGTLDGLYGKMADLYMSEFTREEIKALTDFYKTDLGKKLSVKQVSLMEKAMVFGQSWGMDLYKIAQKYQ
ncbi:DUF2059 domain-containing protein [Aestuariibaculum sediminum]|uniref:DUF2059 domain-containing protein n=1 Tax=Aestuariibaculum sediminum TaxID=2770637 RepID=A0A8J6Q1R7_9FLAO|nr:DUF2059 domain-containing protein [Aestuariibaculum sediminum]MBD0831191.1 DUF2059 domain-containing protein [Aestuariibaculum sediminum]